MIPPGGGSGAPEKHEISGIFLQFQIHSSLPDTGFDDTYNKGKVIHFTPENGPGRTGPIRVPGREKNNARTLAERYGSERQDGGIS